MENHGSAVWLNFKMIKRYLACMNIASFRNLSSFKAFIIFNKVKGKRRERKVFKHPRVQTIILRLISRLLRFPPWLSGKESACQCKRHRFNPWIRKIPPEKEMTTHSSILAWEIQQTEEPCRLPSIGLQRVGHNLVTKQQQIGLQVGKIK